MWNFRHKQNKAFSLQSLVDSNLGIIASCPSTPGAWYYYSFLLDRRKLLHSCWNVVAEIKYITIYRHHIYLSLEWMKRNETTHFIFTHVSCLPWGDLYFACNRVISESHPCLHPVFGPAFTPCTLFQWYPQSNEILFNLSMKCWNSEFYSQGSRVIRCSNCIDRSSENICNSSGGAQEKGRNSVYYQNWWKTKFGSQLFRFVKFSFLVTRFMAYYAETGCSCPLITWLYG